MLLPSVRGAGLYMISEITKGVRRLEGPKGSCGLVIVATTAEVTFAMLRNRAVVGSLELWLLAASPT